MGIISSEGFLKSLCTVSVCLLLFAPFAVYQAEAAPTINVETVDSSSWVGSYASLALDSRDRAGISYYDSTHNDLKYAAWTGSSWNVHTVDSAGFVGLHTAVVFDSHDNPHISYAGDNTLNYASWNGTAWTIQKLDSVGSFTSIALDKKDNPHISYFHIKSTGTLKYAAWTNSDWSVETVDSARLVGEFTSLALDADGNPHISYYDIPNGALKYAWRDSSGWNLQTVDSEGDVGQFTSLALDSSGDAHVSYYDTSNGDLKYAKSTGLSWTIEVVDSNGKVGTDSSMALDSDDAPHISYTDNTNHYLKYASKTGSGWNVQTLGSAGYVGEYTSLAIDQTSLEIDSNDNAHIAFCDVSRYTLKYAVVENSSTPPAKGVSTFSYLNVKPNPVIVGQTVQVQMSIAPPPPTSADRFNGLVLSIMKPDETLTIIGPFSTETNGSLYTCYTPTQIGNYTIQLNYYGQSFASSNTTYLPSLSDPVTLSVQPQQVPRTWIVDDNGAADFSSIRAAVDAALPGDTVFVRNGVYKESLVAIFRKTLSLIGEDNTTTIIDGDVGNGSSYGARIYIQNSTGVVVRGLAIRNGGGIYSAFSRDVLITENVITGCLQGIVLTGTNDTTIGRNVLNYNTLGILLSLGSTNNTVSDNVVTANNGTGIGLDHSDGNVITRNLVFGNTFGFPLYHTGGVRLYCSNSNRVFHNDIIGNSEQAYSWMSFNNTWDDGYPSGGNYWRDYNFTDSNHDGIGDTPYVIDADNIDRYPLMNEFIPNHPLSPPPTQVVPTISTLSVKPNPVGVWQTVSINMSVAPRPPALFERFTGLVVWVTQSDGSSYFLGPFLSDPNGSVELNYVVTQVGVHKLQLSFPGQVFARSNTTYLPSQSATATLIVQQEPVSNLSPSSSQQLEGTQSSSSSSISLSTNSTTGTTQSQSQRINEVPSLQQLNQDGEVESISTPKPLPTSWIAWAVAVIAVVCPPLVYLKKRISSSERS